MRQDGQKASWDLLHKYKKRKTTAWMDRKMITPQIYPESTAANGFAMERFKVDREGRGPSSWMNQKERRSSRKATGSTLKVVL